MRAKSGVAAVRDAELEAATERLYSPALPYHNFQHALHTIAAADDIVARCSEEGIRVDAAIVYYAALLHDAGFHEDHCSLGHESKEAYSARLASDLLLERGVNHKTISKVVDAILSTRRDAQFISTEQKAVRAADLSGLAADYATFRSNSRKLKAEYELLSGHPLSWAEWVGIAAEVIRFYLNQEIRLTSYFSDEHGESAFHRAARENLERFMRDRG